jgi:hypothetical protein
MGSGVVGLEIMHGLARVQPAGLMCAVESENDCMRAATLRASCASLSMLRCTLGTFLSSCFLMNEVIALSSTRPFE